MRRPALRGRLIAAAAAATLVAVIGLGGTTAVLVGRELRNELDQTLRQRATDVARLAISTPRLLRTPGALEAPFGGRSLSVEVVDRSGAVFARSLSLGDRLLPGQIQVRAALARGVSSFIDARLAGDRIRMFVAPLSDVGDPPSGGAVLVSSSTAEIDRTLDRIHRLVLFSALAAAALGAALAALLTNRGLRPLRRLATGAGAIAATSDASLRLEQPPESGELGDLAAVLNEMLAALERARQTERRFLADASHELRTPLTSLRGNAAFVAAHGADPDTLRDIEADAARLARLLDDLLVLEREGAAGRPAETVRLTDVIDNLARPDIRVEVAAGDEDTTVRGDRVALERALGNLIENARVHGPRGGPIEVSLRRRDRMALLSVADAGPGLDPEQAALAVGRFWRAPDASRRPGSGLGLSIVAQVAARHDGRLLIDGARFTLELPSLRGLSEPAPTLQAR